MKNDFKVWILNIKRKEVKIKLKKIFRVEKIKSIIESEIHGIK